MNLSGTTPRIPGSRHLGSAWSNGAPGVHSGGILRRLEGGVVVVSYELLLLRLRSTLWHRMVCNWFPDPGKGLPVRT